MFRIPSLLLIPFVPLHITTSIRAFVLRSFAEYQLAVTLAAARIPQKQLIEHISGLHGLKLQRFQRWNLFFCLMDY